MGLIYGRVKLTCPKTGEEIDMIKDCMDPKGTGDSCEHFKHFGMQGSKIVIVCELGKSEAEKI